MVSAYFFYDGHSLGWPGTITVGVVIVVRIAWVLARRRGRRSRREEDY